MRCIDAIRQSSLTGFRTTSCCIEVQDNGLNRESQVKYDEEQERIYIQLSYLHQSTVIVQSQQEILKELSRPVANKLDESSINLGEDDFYCSECYRRRVNMHIQNLLAKKTELSSIRKQMEMSLTNENREEKELLIEAKSVELTLLKQRNDDLRRKVKLLEAAREMQAIQSRKELLRLRLAELSELREETIIQESLLLSLRADLRRLQAKGVLKSHKLFKINHLFSEFSIGKNLTHVEHGCIKAGEQYESPVISGDPQIRFVKDITVYDTYFAKGFEEQSYLQKEFVQHAVKAITAYSLENLMKFFRLVEKLMSFDVPFISTLDCHQRPTYSKGGAVKRIINENSIDINEENLVLPWVNLSIVYKRLGMDFGRKIITKNLTFSVEDIVMFFENELATLPRQIESKDHRVFLSRQCENDDKNYEMKAKLMRIAYGTQANDKVNNEEVLNYVNKDGNVMRIINFYERKNDNNIANNDNDKDYAVGSDEEEEVVIEDGKSKRESSSLLILSTEFSTLNKSDDSQPPPRGKKGDSALLFKQSDEIEESDDDEYEIL